MADCLSDRVRATTKHVCAHAQDVSVDRKAAKRLAAQLYPQLREGTFSLEQWHSHTLHPDNVDETTCDWVFFIDLLNFSFWNDDDSKPYSVTIDERTAATSSPRKSDVASSGDQGSAGEVTTYRGYFALCACVARAYAEGINITSPSVYSTISRDTLAHVFRSDDGQPMPLFEKRLDALHQAGKVLVEKYGGAFKNCVVQAQHSCQRLMELVFEDFPTFRDIAEYDGAKVYILKRLQILIADLWGCYRATGLGSFHDIESITMFADYRVPQGLVHFGLLKYSDRLLNFLNQGTRLENGSREEVEIRSASIQAVEALVHELRQLRDADASLQDSGALNVNAIIADFYLWDYSKAQAEEMKAIPIHRTRCVYY